MLAPHCVLRSARQCSATETARKVASVILDTSMMAMTVYQQSSVAAYRTGCGLRSELNTVFVCSLIRKVLI